MCPSLEPSFVVLLLNQLSSLSNFFSLSKTIFLFLHSLVKWRKEDSYEKRVTIVKVIQDWMKFFLFIRWIKWASLLLLLLFTFFILPSFPSLLHSYLFSLLTSKPWIVSLSKSWSQTKRHEIDRESWIMLETSCFNSRISGCRLHQDWLLNSYLSSFFPLFFKWTTESYQLSPDQLLHPQSARRDETS